MQNRILSTYSKLKGSLGRKRSGYVKHADIRFDARFYARAYPELSGQSDSELAAHFAQTGWQDGRDPCAGFSTRLYVAEHPELLGGDTDPVTHYQKFQSDKKTALYLSDWGVSGVGRVPYPTLQTLKPYFDAAHYVTQWSGFDALAEGLSDEDLCAHYLTVGWRCGLEPTKEFSALGYLLRNPDVLELGLNPFHHYVFFGKSEGRQGMVNTRMRDVFDRMFDTGYISAGLEPSLKVPPTHPMASLLARRETLVTDLMLQSMSRKDQTVRSDLLSLHVSDSFEIGQKDLRAALRYVARAAGGRAKSRSKAMVQQTGLNETELSAVRKVFDADFYRAKYSDVTGDDEQALGHFLTHGWRDGRDPCREFSTNYYKMRYADVAESGMNPFVHWVVWGKSEGRSGQHLEQRPLDRISFARTTQAYLQAVFRTPPPDLNMSPPKTVDTSRLDIHWVVPDFQKGGGGHMTIFRMVRFLENFGHRCTIWIDNPDHHDTVEEAYDDIVKHFQCVEAQVRFVSDGFWEATGDAVIATGWTTAYAVEKAGGFRAKYYFVQDHEPEFYATGTDHLLAKRTYSFDMATICASPWLEELMRERYGRWSRSFYLAYDRDLYNLGSQENRAQGTAGAEVSDETPRKKIAVYARKHTARRCVDLVLLALEELARTRDDFEVHFFGQDKLDFDATPYASITHGVMSPEKLADLYRECDLAVTFSGTNYSLVPQEMMACGLPIIELDGGPTRAIFPDDVVTLSGPDPLDVVDKIAACLDAPDRLAAQAERALDWVAQFDWEKSARDVEAAIRDYLVESGAPLAAPAVQPDRDVLLDVIVPTYKGRKEFPPVLEALRGQAMADRMNIICVDSSSPDGTGEWLAQQKDVQLEVIAQKDFQHGRTRNFGASLGSAPIMAFLTQDAIPVNAHWATDILKMFAHFPEGAGLFGRHLPYPQHPFYVRDEINNHFANMANLPLALSRHTDPEAWASGDTGWRQVLHFYSDNNSAMRRDIWNDIPYPDVDYGEDQVWAREIIEAGHTKLYAPTAMVYHSHNYGPEETYDRAKTEAAFFYEHFGYEIVKTGQQELDQDIAREVQNFEDWARVKNADPELIEMRKKAIAEGYRGRRDGLLAAKAAKG